MNTIVFKMIKQNSSISPGIGLVQGTLKPGERRGERKGLELFTIAMERGSDMNFLLLRRI